MLVDLDKLVFESGQAGGIRVTWLVDGRPRSKEMDFVTASILQSIVDRIGRLEEAMKEKV